MRTHAIRMAALLLMLAGCATAPVERAVQPLPEGGQTVTIEMVRFTFLPDVITLRAGIPAKITAVSNSGIPHNITILSPGGGTLKTVDIAARGTAILEATQPKPGRYIFYCDKLLHRWPFAMKGTLDGGGTS